MRLLHTVPTCAGSGAPNVHFADDKSATQRRVGVDSLARYRSIGLCTPIPKQFNSRPGVLAGTGRRLCAPASIRLRDQEVFFIHILEVRVTRYGLGERWIAIDCNRPTSTPHPTTGPVEVPCVVAVGGWGGLFSVDSIAPRLVSTTHISWPRRRFPRSIYCPLHRFKTWRLIQAPRMRGLILPFWPARQRDAAAGGRSRLHSRRAAQRKPNRAVGVRPRDEQAVQ